MDSRTSVPTPPSPNSITPESRKAIKWSSRSQLSSPTTSSPSPSSARPNVNNSFSNYRRTSTNISTAQSNIPVYENSTDLRSRKSTVSRLSTATTSKRSSLISRCASLFHPSSSQAKENTKGSRQTEIPMRILRARKPGVVSDKPLPALPIYKHINTGLSRTFLDPRPAPLPPTANRAPAQTPARSTPERSVTTCWAAENYKPWWETPSPCPSRRGRYPPNRCVPGLQKEENSEETEKIEMEMKDLPSTDSGMVKEDASPPKPKPHEATRRYGVQFSYSHPSLRNLRRSIDVHESQANNKTAATKSVAGSISDSASNYDEDEDDHTSADDDAGPITPEQLRPPSCQTKRVAIHRDSSIGYDDIVDLYLLPTSTSVFRNEHTLSLDTPVRSPLDKIKDAAKQVRFEKRDEEVEDRNIGVVEVESESGDKTDGVIGVVSPLPKKEMVSSSVKPSLKELMRMGRERQQRMKRVERIMTVLRKDTD